MLSDFSFSWFAEQLEDRAVEYGDNDLGELEGWAAVLGCEDRRAAGHGYEDIEAAVIGSQDMGVAGLGSDDVGAVGPGCQGAIGLGGENMGAADMVHAAKLVRGDGCVDHVEMSLAEVATVAVLEMPAEVGPSVVSELHTSAEVLPVGVLVNSTAVNGGGGTVPVPPAKKGLTCPHGGVAGIHGMSKLMLHVDRMHSRPYTYNICRVEFVDRYHFNLHSQAY